MRELASAKRLEDTLGAIKVCLGRVCTPELPPISHPATRCAEGTLARLLSWSCPQSCALQGSLVLYKAVTWMHVPAFSLQSESSGTEQRVATKDKNALLSCEASEKATRAPDSRAAPCQPPCHEVYLTQSFFQVVLRKSISTQIRVLIFYASNSWG